MIAPSISVKKCRKNKKVEIDVQMEHISIVSICPPQRLTVTICMCLFQPIRPFHVPCSLSVRHAAYQSAHQSARPPEEHIVHIYQSVAATGAEQY
jgi:hypothetical protein